jgi:predicted CXXCH cytochrome family protein
MQSHNVTKCGLSVLAILALLNWAHSAGSSNLAAHRPGASSRSCADCHIADPLFSHPVNFVPTVQLPAQFPLENGRMTCLTCHSDVGQGLARHSTDSAEMLCQQCHGDEKTGISLHATGTEKAHLNWGRTAPTSGLDAISRTCLTCHDGSSASDVGIQGGGLGKHSNGHPVGIRYAMSKVDRLGRPEGDMRLVPASSLDPRLRLVEGNVGCTTCHSPYSPHKDQLVFPNFRSALCYGCHRG